MSAGGRKIGFVDFDLENFHANVYLAALRGELAGRGFELAGCSARQEASGRAWAEKNGVPYVPDPRRLARAVDCVTVLAPSNPEVHLELCRRVLPAGRPTFVDKTFAPDLRTARRIFALADRGGAPVQSSSPLRYTAVQAWVRQAGPGAVRHVAVWGGGRSFDEYAVHPVEMAVSCLGPEAESLMRRGGGGESQLLVNFSGGRTAVISVYTNADTPFAAALSTARQTRLLTVETSRLFVDAAAAMLDFFEAGGPQVPRAETLAVMGILDAARSARALKRFVKIRR